MARFQTPGFKTRQRQAHDAKFGIRPHFPNTAECMKPAPMNPCRAVDLDPFNQPGEMKRRMRGTGLTFWLAGQLKVDGVQRPRKGPARAVNKWEDFDTHKPKGWRVCFRDSYRYTRRLEAHGFKTLGSGFYSTVLGKPGWDKVIKICRNGGDDAYPMFAAWAAENPSPYLPRIHSFKRHSGFYVVVLDRLARTTAQAHPNQGWAQTTDMIQAYARGHEFSGMRKAFLGTIWNELPGLKDVVDGFVKEFRGQASFDMHDGNWMLTEDGKLVMTDPLAGTNTNQASQRNSAIKRIRSGALRAVVRLAA